jgi:hypothetical protein
VNIIKHVLIGSAISMALMFVVSHTPLAPKFGLTQQ